VATLASPPRLAWYGDDFTGASDTLATLAQAGLQALLFLDVPTPAQLAAAGALDAIGIAGAARAMDPAAMRTALQPVARFFASCGAQVLHYKCCSTFDSAPHVGSIGEAVRTLAEPLAQRLVPIVGGQPSLGRYCAFGQLFAVAAAGGTVWRIDRHPTMSRHPVTPMHEADLRVHLAAQGLADIALVDLREADPSAALDALQPGSGPLQPVLFDVTADHQLAAIGALLWQRSQQAPLLAVGASSVAQALIDHWGLPRAAHDGRVAPAHGPVLAWAGSLSPISSLQVQAARSYQRLPIDAARLAGGDTAYVDACRSTLANGLREGRHMLAHTTPTPDTACTIGTPSAPAAADGALAAASARLLREVLHAAPVTRVGVAGGDTSSHAVQALAPWALSWLGRPAPGVALCRARADDAVVDGLELMLKGGQMGGEDLFERLVGGTG
jgi:uncharacterized protein YgbK (DUF1537 family)